MESSQCAYYLRPEDFVCVFLSYKQMLIVDLTEGAENTFITCVSIACPIFPLKFINKST